MTKRQSDEDGARTGAYALVMAVSTMGWAYVGGLVGGFIPTGIGLAFGLVLWAVFVIRMDRWLDERHLRRAKRALRRRERMSPYVEDVEPEPEDEDRPEDRGFGYWVEGYRSVDPNRDTMPLPVVERDS